MAHPNQNPNQYLFSLNEFGVDPNQFVDPYAHDPLIDTNTEYTQGSDPPSYTHTSQNSSTCASTSSTTTGSKRRKKTSMVWEYFEEEEYEEGGVRKSRARCKRPGCNSVMSMGSGGGTGHLKRHIESHMKKEGESAAIQSRLQYNPDGTVRNFVYDQEKQRDGLGCLIATNDLPLGFGESPAFVQYIRTYHTPQFQPVSRQTTTRDMKKMCKQALTKIKDDFTTCTFSVSLTSDIWTGRAKQDYISVVAHYVNDKWELQKRILGFELIDISHTGENIAQAIINVVANFGLTDKIFAVTLDNASSNTTAMNTLSPLFSTYAASFLMHQRCACHIINLIAKSCINIVENPHIERLRTAISFMNSSTGRIGAYKRYCVLLEVTPHKYNLDMPIRWNSTYLMINHVLPDKVHFTEFINQHYKTNDGSPLLTAETWHILEVMNQFFQLFYESTVALSGVYYPTSPLMVHHILDIAQHLQQYENDPILHQAIAAMKEKYLKYWSQIPLLYAFAFILDPRGKLDGFAGILSLLTAAVHIDYTAYFTTVRDKLNEVYCKYEQKYASVRQQRPPPAPVAAKKKGAWGKIFGSSSTSSSSSHSAPVTSAYCSGELAKYLSSDVVPHHEDDDFNILQWWQEHKQQFPVLSILARDVISVPVSTISSESAFSLAGRILEERRTSLTPDMVKTLMCIKDSELAKMRAQHSTDN
jgi:hypothetical protein